MERKTLVEDCYILCGCKKDSQDSNVVCDKHRVVLVHFMSDLLSWEILNNFFNLLMEDPKNEYNRIILNTLGNHATYSGLAKLIGENPYVIRILEK